MDCYVDCFGIVCVCGYFFVLVMCFFDDCVYFCLVVLWCVY